MSSAFPQLLRLSSETASWWSLPASKRRPSRRHACRTERDLGLHVRELLLHELSGGERPAELPALEGVAPRGVPAELGRAHRAPADSVAGPGEAGEGRLHAFRPGQHVLGRHEHVVHDDLPGGGGAQRELALDAGRAQAPHALLEEEAAQRILLVLRPHHEHVGEGRMADPGLGAAEHEAAFHRFRPCPHARRIGAGVRFGEPETPKQGAPGQPGEVLPPLRLAPVGVDGVHHQARLHAESGAVGTVDALDLAGHQPVAHVADPRAAVTFERGAEQPERSHFAHDLRVEALVAV